MRVVLQRVARASVEIDGAIHSQIGAGLLILLGIEPTDTQEDAEWLVKKIAALRIFDDEKGVMNRNVVDIDGQLLVVSQFTLMASYKKGIDRAISALPVPKLPFRSTNTSWRKWKRRREKQSKRAFSVQICRFLFSMTVRSRSPWTRTEKNRSPFLSYTP